MKFQTLAYLLLTGAAVAKGSGGHKYGHGRDTEPEPVGNGVKLGQSLTENPGQN